MNILSDTTYTIELDAAELALLGGGYCSEFSASNMAWFLRQVLDNKHRREDIAQWFQRVVMDKNLDTARRDHAEMLWDKVLDRIPNDAWVLVTASIGPVKQNPVGVMGEVMPSVIQTKPCVTEESSMEKDTKSLDEDTVKELYPRVASFGLPVRVYRSGSPHFIPRGELQKALRKHEETNPGFTHKFHELFGIQTMCIYGSYPRDVEAVLERLISGRRTGTQLVFD